MVTIANVCSNKSSVVRLADLCRNRSCTGRLKAGVSVILGQCLWEHTRTTCLNVMVLYTARHTFIKCCRCHWVLLEHHARSGCIELFMLLLGPLYFCSVNVEGFARSSDWYSFIHSFSVLILQSLHVQFMKFEEYSPVLLKGKTRQLWPHDG